MARRQRIMFVDDELRVLQGIRRMMRSARCDCDVVFARSGRQALEKLAREPADVVVADLRMPGMDGAQLLSAVRKRHPQTVRIALSGAADRQTTLRVIAPKHRYLSKPCSADRLRATLDAVSALPSLLSNISLKRSILRMKSLPSLPSLFCEVANEIQSAEPSLQRVGRTVARDVGMTAAVLQLASSSAFGVDGPVSDPAQAVTTLGLDTMRILIDHVFSSFDRAEWQGLSLGTLPDHSAMVGALAQRIARAEGVGKKGTAYARAAGTLHDVGKLVFAASFPVEYAEVLSVVSGDGMELLEAEREAFCATHVDAGVYLLKLWGLPEPIVEAVADHHTPPGDSTKPFGPRIAVWMANFLEHEPRLPRRAAPVAQPDASYLTSPGIADRLPSWRRIFQEMNQ